MFAFAQCNRTLRWDTGVKSFVIGSLFKFIVKIVRFISQEGVKMKGILLDLNIE